MGILSVNADSQDAFGILAKKCKVLKLISFVETVVVKIKSRMRVRHKKIVAAVFKKFWNDGRNGAHQTSDQWVGYGTLQFVYRSFHAVVGKDLFELRPEPFVIIIAFYNEHLQREETAGIEIGIYHDPAAG